MGSSERIERALERAIENGESPGYPPLLGRAIRHAVFPGGARIRPRLCLAVARACGEDAVPVTDSVAVAIELMHCASLVHDDLPCFDDAPLRRGRASVHVAYGEPLAVLAGDALIVLAFETIARWSASRPERMAPLLLQVARAVGMPSGIVAGQAWECETEINLSTYHRAKTGSLFAAATVAGATAAGRDPEEWRAFGELIGEAYQVADDLQDAAAEAADIGKPVGRDAELGRASAAIEYGIQGAIARLDALVAGAKAAIPDCRGSADLEALIVSEARRFLPKSLVRSPA
jgi:geranylgeranyl diphosphate synthase type II